MTRLDPALEDWLLHFNKQMETLRQKGVVPTPELARQGLSDITRALVTDTPDVAMVVNSLLDTGHRQIPVRIYHPEPERELPVLIYLHGGGHMAGSVEVYDPICRKLARASGRIVISVEYRLAPEHPYPEGIEDGEKILLHWRKLCIAHNLKFCDRMALGGDSAGGAMSATLAHRHHQTTTIEALLLIYPSLDYTIQHGSIDEFNRGYLLEWKKIKWYFSQYFQHGENREAVSPLHMDVSQSFPRTMVVTAGYCPLRDEAVAYIEKLHRNRIAVQHLHFASLIHAFLNMENLVPDACRTFYREVARFLT